MATLTPMRHNVPRRPFQAWGVDRQGTTAKKSGRNDVAVTVADALLESTLPTICLNAYGAIVRDCNGLGVVSTCQTTRSFVVILLAKLIQALTSMLQHTKRAPPSSTRRRKDPLSPEVESDENPAMYCTGAMLRSRRCEAGTCSCDKRKR